MHEIYVPLPSKENLSLYERLNFDGFLVGIKGFSSNFNYCYDIEELKELNTKKKVYICLNRLYYNSEIDDVKNLVKELIKLDITGICYTDIGVLNILNELGFDKDIFWISNHMGTNSKTINFLEKRNVDLALLSNEITIDEIINIKKNTNIKIGAKLYGFLNMATSSRKLITNYFDYTDTKKDKDKYEIEDKVKKDKYIIVEERDTNFFTGKVLNGLLHLPRLLDNNIDFIFLDSYMLDEKEFYNVAECFVLLKSNTNDEKYLNDLNEVVKTNSKYETFDGFLDKKTVFKVEDYE